MKQITPENRKEFDEKAKWYREKAKEILEKEKEMLNLIKRDNSGVSYKKMLLVEEMIYVSTLFMAVNSLSLEILNTKNNEALNDARKILYKAIIYLEDVVTDLVDAPFSEYSKKLEEIENIPLEKRYSIIQKLGLSMRMLTDAYGENTKWKWSFVELEARFATISKNLIDLKSAVKAFFDPRDPEYETTVSYLRLVMSLLDEAASGYRDKYELSTRRLDDMRLGIQYLLALRRIQILLGKSEEAENLKKKALVWKSKMESDQKKERSN
ncbi:MAG TPA: hypothetical protein VFC68_06585 [Treponemataceae bacterium]|nr:hypothetical protein [Treponemataceae bacterium]